MKICFVGPADSAHIVKWCNWFSNRGHDIHVISFTPGEIDSATVHRIDAGVDPDGSDIGKLKYLLTGKQIKRIIDEVQPDVVNAHYATSYGIAMALSGIKGYILSVWGSDIYVFPKKSPFHRALLKYSLRKAGYLFSTSQAMADEAGKYTSRHFEITPFGVDMELFNPSKRTRKEDLPFTVGTVKSLSDGYGIRYILEAVAEIKRQGRIPIVLRIAGKGQQEQEYRELAEKLNIDDITTWLGFISQEQAAVEWANMDVAIIPSLSESFGVSAIEAQACGTAVIISDVAGLLETTDNGSSGVVVERKNEKAIAEAITDLYFNPEKRKLLGEHGRNYAVEKFELNHCFEHIATELEKGRTI